MSSLKNGVRTHMISKPELFEKFKRLTYEDYQKMAEDDSLTPSEKIGFPEEYRNGFEPLILEDICSKLPELKQERKTLMDIGSGCGKLSFNLIQLCEEKNHQLLLVDSSEMLSHLPEKPFIQKFPCRFPESPELLSQYKEKVDFILVYSVIHIVSFTSNIFTFLDQAVQLLAAGGKMLIGDLPNVSKRKRFFSSPSGIQYHQNFTQSLEKPAVELLKVEEEKLDDAVIFAILNRYRNFGFETYLLPQKQELPFANRREDILIVKW